MKQIKSIETLVMLLCRFPGVGRKSAERMAYHILKADANYASALSSAVLAVKEKVRYCRICSNLTEDEVCEICADESRDRSIICVVEEFTDLMAVEKSGSFRGLYHVLQGTLAPLRGITPENLRIPELMRRVSDGSIKEIIVATNPTVDGDATALYLNKELGKYVSQITRLGLGIPIGGSLEYADDITLKKSLEGRSRL